MSKNFRPHEDWMVKGARVKLPNNNGVLATVSKTVTEDGVMVMGVSVQYDGNNKAFPVGAWDIEKE